MFLNRIFFPLAVEAELPPVRRNITHSIASLFGRWHLPYLVYSDLLLVIFGRSSSLFQTTSKSNAIVFSKCGF